LCADGKALVRPFEGILIRFTGGQCSVIAADNTAHHTTNASVDVAAKARHDRTTFNLSTFHLYTFHLYTFPPISKADAHVGLQKRSGTEIDIPGDGRALSRHLHPEAQGESDG
jgi:hypothetical protein